jgi:virginiamycin B lyase
LAAIAAALFVPSAAAAPHIDGEFPIPAEVGTNNKIVQGPDGNMWLTVNGGGKDVAKITPAGAVTEYELEAITASGIAVGPEGRIWITRNGDVITFDPADPEGTKVTTSVPEIGTEHSITRGPDGNMWVATNNKVLRIQAGDPTKVQPFPVEKLVPKDIDAAGSLLAVADSGEKPRIVTLTTDGSVNEYELPGGSQGVAGTSGGLIAFSQQSKTPEQVGLINPPTAQPLIETPGGIGDPFGVAFGSDDAFWFAMSGNDGVARLTMTGQLTLLNGFAEGSFPRQVAAGPDNTIWVTLDLVDKVGRISGLEPPVFPKGVPPVSPETKIDKGPKGKVRTKKKKAKVKFRFSSPNAGATFECRMVRKPKKGKKAPKPPAFKGCKSPKSYKLKPGRYTFEVRAVLAGKKDPTPAKRSFRVIRIKKR